MSSRASTGRRFNVAARIARVSREVILESLEARRLLSVTVLSETFEQIFPTEGGWAVGDANGAGTAAYWDDVQSGFGNESPHGGSWMGYCAGVGKAGTYTAPLYQNNMLAYMSKNIDLSALTSATLNFWYMIPGTEASYDFLRVYIGATKVFETSSTLTSWTQGIISLNAYIGTSPTLKFEFRTDGSVTKEGAYLDDILVTGEKVPDLKGANCAAPATADWGGTISVQGRVQNIGTAAATATFYQNFYLSNDTVFGDADDVYLGYYTHSADVPNGGQGPDFSVNLLLPSSVPAGYAAYGTCYIGMKTDANANVTETNELNNFGTIGAGYDYDSITIGRQPDLSGWDCYAPSSASWGDTISVQGQVRNTGGAATSAPCQHFYLSNDTVFGDADDRYLGFYTYGGGVPADGYSADFSKSLTLPGAAPEGFTSGRYYIGMKTDADLSVSESNESNNFATMGVTRDYDIISINAAGPGNIVIDGTAGNDLITVGIAGDYLRVTRNGTATDYFLSSVFSLTINGLDGNDTVNVGPDILMGVTVNGGAGADSITGGNGSDIIDGGAGGDWIAGLAGADSIYGYNGADSVYGGPGADYIVLGGGDDLCYAGLNNDSVWGHLGSDTIVGDNTDDLLYGDEDSDLINGGDGNDTVNGGAGADQLIGVGGNDVMYGGADDDRLSGGYDNDAMFGGPGNDSMQGGMGNDSLTGGEGVDTLLGEIGSDSLSSGNDGSADVLTGGPDWDYAVRDQDDSVLDVIESDMLALG